MLLGTRIGYVSHGAEKAATLTHALDAIVEWKQWKTKGITTNIVNEREGLKKIKK